jgi:hypothetical protein
MTHSIKPVKYPAAHALRIIDGNLANELNIHRFDDRTRSKVQLFALGSREGKQFAIILGDTDAETELHSRKQTRIILEPCTLPTLPGIEPYTKPYKGGSIKNSKLAQPTHVSCLVEDESALRELLRWYSARDQMPQTLNRESLQEFRQRLQSPTGSTEVQRIVAQRVGQDIFRRALIEYWQARCAASGLNVVPLLRASHIKPWKACENDEERLDVFNGLLLAPQLDALFDSGWITFSDDGEMVISDLLRITQRKLLGITEDLSIRCLTESHRNYLRYHRAECFERWKK